MAKNLYNAGVHGIEELPSLLTKLHTRCVEFCFIHEQNNAVNQFTHWIEQINTPIIINTR